LILFRLCQLPHAFRGSFGLGLLSDRCWGFGIIDLPMCRSAGQHQFYAGDGSRLTVGAGDARACRVLDDVGRLSAFRDPLLAVHVRRTRAPGGS